MNQIWGNRYNGGIRLTTGETLTLLAPRLTVARKKGHDDSLLLIAYSDLSKDAEELADAVADSYVRWHVLHEHENPEFVVLKSKAKLAVSRRKWFQFLKGIYSLPLPCFGGGMILLQWSRRYPPLVVRPVSERHVQSRY